LNIAVQNAWIIISMGIETTAGTCHWQATQTNSIDGDPIQFASGQDSSGGGGTGLVTYSGQLPPNLDANDLVIDITTTFAETDPTDSATVSIYSISVFDYYTDVLNPGVPALSPSGITTQIALGTSGWYDSHALAVVGNVGVSGNVEATNLYYAGQDTDERYTLSGLGGGGVTVHSLLDGLEDNDHPQYLLVADALTDYQASGLYQPSGNYQIYS
jgi:hypothetical protein